MDNSPFAISARINTPAPGVLISPLDTMPCVQQPTAAPMLQSGTSSMVSLLSVRLNDQQKPGVMNDARPTSCLPVKHMMRWLAIPFLIAPALMANSAVQADTLQDYAQQCDKAMGIGATVQDFDCDAGTEVPVTHYTGSGTCDEPNRLNLVCDPGSHFQVLTRTDDAYVVGHCRKKGNASGEYGDIAVIQFNRKNGATVSIKLSGRVSQAR